MQQLCEQLAGNIACVRIIEDVARFPKRKGVLGYVEGIFSQCDVENKNGRIYERALWEEVLRKPKYRSAIEGLTLLGEPDHPETRTQSMIREGSHTVVEMHLDGDGRVRGVVAIFDNALGRMIWPMLEAGVRLGFSTRGDGDLLEDKRTGKTRVDPNTYEFHGVDFVLNPSFVEAMPTSITESQTIYQKVRVALTEAVESKKYDDATLSETAKNIKALFEAAPAKSAEPAKRGLEAALESALRQLSEAKTQLTEFKAENARLVGEVNDRAVEGAKAIAVAKTLKTQVTEGLKEIEGLKKKVVAEANARKAEVIELKKVLVENQSAQLKFAGTHRDLQASHAELQAKHQKGIELVEQLKARVLAGEKKLLESQQQSTALAKKLEEQSKSIPSLVSNESLRQYKRAKVENLTVPESFKPLLENARTEDEVNTVVDAILAAQAHRFPYLPIGPNSRAERKQIADRMVESAAEAHRQSEGNEQDDQDARDIEAAAGAQLRR